MPRQMFLEAGQIVGTHGVRGEMRVQPWCDSPGVLASLSTLYLDDTGARSVKIQARVHKNLALVKMDGVETVTAAEAMRGRILYLNRNDVQLEPGRHFIRDLIGLRIVDADTGETYGELTDVSATGANDVYHMKDRAGREILIPAIPQVIIQIDVDGGVIRLRPMPGLLDDEI